MIAVSRVTTFLDISDNQGMQLVKKINKFSREMSRNVEVSVKKVRFDVRCCGVAINKFE